MRVLKQNVFNIEMTSQRKLKESDFFGAKQRGKLLVVTWAFGSKVCRDNTARTKGNGIAHLTTKTVLSGEHR